MENINNYDFNEEYTKHSVRIGRTTVILIMIASFLPNIYLYIRYGAAPTLSIAMQSWMGIAAVYCMLYFIEPFTYYSIMGITGTYMGFFSGNITNMRFPAATVAMDSAGVEQGTNEGEVISTLGIGGSVVLSTIVLIIAVTAGTVIMNALPAAIRETFQQYTLPAIFGGLAARFILQNYKLSIYAITIPIVLLLVLPITKIFIMLIAIIIDIALSRALYKKSIIK